MPFVDISSLPVTERLSGWYGRYFHSSSMTFAHYDFVRGSSIHEHFHPQEEVFEVTDGELEVTIDGVAQIARAGMVAVVPAGSRHSVKALTVRPGHHRRLSAEARLQIAALSGDRASGWSNGVTGSYSGPGVRFWEGCTPQ